MTTRDQVLAARGALLEALQATDYATELTALCAIVPPDLRRPDVLLQATEYYEELVSFSRRWGVEAVWFQEHVNNVVYSAHGAEEESEDRAAAGLLRTEFRFFAGPSAGLEAFRLADPDLRGDMTVHLPIYPESLKEQVWSALAERFDTFWERVKVEVSAHPLAGERNRVLKNADRDAQLFVSYVIAQREKAHPHLSPVEAALNVASGLFGMVTEGFESGTAAKALTRFRALLNDFPDI